MDFSAKIYFDQVSAPFSFLTPWLSPFSCLHFFCSCFPPVSTVDKRNVLLDGWAPSPEPCVPESLSQWACAPVTLILNLSQSDGQREKWLIGARPCDLRQGEHTQSYSSRSYRGAITGALLWVMSCAWPCMRRPEELRDALTVGSTLAYTDILCLTGGKKTWCL